MKIFTANFAKWPLWDGYYSPYKTGDKCSFVLFSRKTEIRKAGNRVFYLRKHKYSGYSFSGKVIRIYKEYHDWLIIVNTGDLNLLMWHRCSKGSLRKGQFLEGSCVLEIDSEYALYDRFFLKDPPVMEYAFEIRKIKGVIFPEGKYVIDDEVSISSVDISPYKITPEHFVAVDDMADDPHDTVIYLLDLEFLGEG